MNLRKWAFVVSAAAGLALVGCSKRSGPSVDTIPLEKSFKAAQPAVRARANKAVSAVKAGDYPSAIAELKTLASNAKLTPDQRQAVKNVTAQTERAQANIAARANEIAAEAIRDMKRNMPK